MIGLVVSAVCEGDAGIRPTRRAYENEYSNVKILIK